MANKLYVKAGNASIEASPELFDLVDTLLNKALPETKEEINKSLNKIHKDAKAQWLIRAKKSKGSINKLEKGLRIEGEDLVGFVRNTAPYAWAIKIGEKSQNSSGRSSLHEGRRLSNEVLWKPIKKTADGVAEALANDLMRMI